MLRAPFRRRLRFILLSLSIILASAACSAATPPKILLVVAHPDDELLAAATIYHLTQEVGGTVDQLVITNGEGGYRYSTLAEKIYGLNLTNEEVARRELPSIRQREALEAGKILGIRNHAFLGEPDVDNTDDPDDVLQGPWNVEHILNSLGNLLKEQKYDFVLVPLPRPDIGGHHMAATLLSIRALARFDGQPQPVLLGSFFEPEPFESTMDETAGFSGAPDFDFDRSRSFGFNDKLDYQIVVNWVIAEHKSQGLYQKNIGRFGHENFWVFNRSDPDVRERADALFALLAAPGSAEGGIHGAEK